MVDPLSQIIAQLQPRAVYMKHISAAGSWGVRYTEFGNPSFCVVTEGRCRLIVDGEAPETLEAGDFVLLPATPGFVLSGLQPVIPVRIDPHQAAAETADELRYGAQAGEPDLRMLGGFFEFDSPDAALLVSLLPRIVHVGGVDRLTALVQMVGGEAKAGRPGRDHILVRLVEVLLVEALRHSPRDDTPPGLLRGLADDRIARALRAMHADPARPWTVQELARDSGLSRSAFFDRFVRKVGSPPMDYLLGWRMAIARNLLCKRSMSIEAVAERVGYASASTFSTAFRRCVGRSPGLYARQGRGASAR